MNTAVRWISLICNLIQMEVAITKAYNNNVDESCKQRLDGLKSGQLRLLQSLMLKKQEERRM